jgi:tetratricopeptide (TPR) repeat protein
MADVLAGREATRPKALAEYKKILAAQPYDERSRVKYAKLLLAEKGDAPEAARQFERVLQKEPRNGEAHRGAARAYAWLGERDMALMHTNKAAAIEASNPEVRSMSADLGRGREPRAGGKLRGLNSDSLTGFAAGAFAQRDAGPFTTIEAEILSERYADDKDSATGAAAAFAAEVRLGENRRINAAFGLSGLGEVSAQTHRLSVTLGTKYVSITPGIARQRKEESLLALVGRDTPTGRIGQAREDIGYVEVATAETTDGRRFGLTPAIGFVQTADGGHDARQSLDAWIEKRFVAEEPWELGAAFKVTAMHYEEDRSGLEPSKEEPRPGGFYSPRLAAFQTPQLVLRFKSGADTRGEIRAGPSLQYERTVARGMRTMMGVDASAYGELVAYDSYFVDATAAYARSPAVPGRVEAGLRVARRF